MGVEVEEMSILVVDRAGMNVALFLPLTVTGFLLPPGNRDRRGGGLGSGCSAGSDPRLRLRLGDEFYFCITITSRSSFL